MERKLVNELLNTSVEYQGDEVETASGEFITLVGGILRLALHQRRRNETVHYT